MSALMIELESMSKEIYRADDTLPPPNAATILLRAARSDGV